MIEEPTPAGALERASPGELAEVAGEPVPDDFYVTLRPLTLELVARQLERMSIDFTSLDGVVRATWTGRYTLTAMVGVGDVLHLRVRLADAFPTRMASALEARCNWWNSVRGFLKASASVGLVRSSDDDEDEEDAPSLAAIVALDVDLPYRVGIAPVQLQALVTDVLRNVDRFEAEARLGDLELGGTWG
jgi:hypothetical protein